MVLRNTSYNWHNWRGFIILSSLVFALCLSAGMAFAALPASQGGDTVSTSAGPNMADIVPSQVRDGSATLIGKHSDADVLTVLFASSLTSVWCKLYDCDTMALTAQPDLVGGDGK